MGLELAVLGLITINHVVCIVELVTFTFSCSKRLQIITFVFRHSVLHLAMTITKRDPYLFKVVAPLSLMGIFLDF